MLSALQPSLGNELDILHREFLKSTAIIIESEQETARYYKELSGETYVTPQESNWRKDMVDENLHLYNETEKRWKLIRKSELAVVPCLPNYFLPEMVRFQKAERWILLKTKGFCQKP